MAPEERSTAHSPMYVLHRVIPSGMSSSVVVGFAGLGPGEKMPLAAYGTGADPHRDATSTPCCRQASTTAADWSADSP